MADTWAVPGYGVPAYDQTEMDRIRMMQQLLMRQQTQNVAPPMPAQPDVSMPQPDTGRNDPVLDANQNVLMRDAMMQQRQQAAPAPAPVSPQQASVRMPPPELGDRRDAPQDPMQLTARRAAIGASLTPQQQALVTPAPQTQQTPDDPAPGAMPVGATAPQTPDGPAPGAMPVKRTPFMGEGDQNQAQSVPGEPMNIVPKAMENVTQEPQGFLAKAQSWLDKVGSVFTVQTQGQDPNAINPAYGVPNAMVWNAQRNALFNAGVVLMAAGMPNTPQGRAQIIQQLGPALSNVTKDIYNMAQSRLMAAKASGEGADDTANQRDYQLAVNQGYKGTFLDYQRDVKGMTPDAQLGSKMATNWIDNKNGGYTRAVLASSSITTLNEMMQLVDEGIAAGMLSSAQEKLLEAKVATNTATEEEKQKLVRTQQINSLVMQRVLPLMQQLGGSDSNEELRKLTEAVLNRNWQPETMLGNMRRAVDMEAKALERLRSERKGITALREGIYEVPETPSVYQTKNYANAPGLGTAGGTVGNANPDGETSQGGEVKPDASWKQVRNPKTGETGFRDPKSGKIYVLKNGKWEPLANGK